MNEQLDRFETIKIATQYWHGDSKTATLIIIIFILTFVILLLSGFLLQRYLKSKNAKAFFIRFAKNRKLTDREIEILWEYAQKMERDPMLVLEFKAPFEKVIDLYVKSDPNADENLIRDMRKKLDFMVHSPYVPLITTKDIEIFQGGRMIVDNRAIDVALYDKDERYMYWLVVNDDLPDTVVPGDPAKVIFIRKDDGIYTITLPITEIIREEGRTLVKLPHTFELYRTQRREYPRIKIDQPVQVELLDWEGQDGRVFQGRFRDIGAGGGRICFEKVEEPLKKLHFGDTLLLRFTLLGTPFQLKFKVLEKDISPKSLCLRGTFVDIDESVQNEIMEFVQRELLRMAQLNRQKSTP
ncbi:MAG: PilZ domain-containing protein [Epsilonproteobacteria bacterium]|nr:PilZ domain-containing protein [Campylobacterota bacterium]NPA56882.1 PilZ domain-containing protein [Campylobacterota bacterium]